MANQYFTCVLDAWREGKTLYGRMHYYRSGSYYYQDSSFPNPTMNLAGTTYTDTDFGNRVRSGIYVGDVYSTTFSRTVAGTGDRTVTWSAGSGQRSDFAGTWSKTVNFPVEYTAPTGLNISLLEIYPNGAKMNVSISSYGNPSSASDRYLEAQICVANDYSSTRKYKHGTHGASSLSQQITVTNNDYTGGSLNIVANTQYYYAGYANNTQKQTSKIQGQFVTTAYAPTMAVKETTSDSAVIEYSLKADGGYYAKNVQYSLDNGTTWVTGATINSSSATTGTFTINNLNADTSYHIKTRVSTASGETAGNELSFNTFQDIKFYGSVNTQTTEINRLYGSKRTLSISNYSIGTGDIITSFKPADMEKNAPSRMGSSLNSPITRVNVVYTQATTNILIEAVLQNGNTYSFFDGPIDLVAVSRARQLGIQGVNVLYSDPPATNLSDYINITSTVGFKSKLIKRFYGPDENGEAKLIYQV